MKRVVALVLTVCCTMGFGMSSAAQVSQGCDPQRLDWSWCGDHVRARHLPLHFSYNPTGAPTGLPMSVVTRAIAAATAEWDRFWPKTSDGCMPLCFDGENEAGFQADGVNTISWGYPVRCPGIRSRALSGACSYFEGQKGLAAKRIKEVDILLNPSYDWKQPEAVVDGQLDPNGAVLYADGQVQGATFDRASVSYPSTGEVWYDFQSALMHELGHALGLEDIGNVDHVFPADLTDASRYQQVMYRWAYQHSTNKRWLHEGDIAGLQQVAARSRNDR